MAQGQGTLNRVGLNRGLNQGPRGPSAPAVVVTYRSLLHIFHREQRAVVFAARIDGAGNDGREGVFHFRKLRH